jgi:Na+/alanine symporter
VIHAIAVTAHHVRIVPHAITMIAKSATHANAVTAQHAGIALHAAT